MKIFSFMLLLLMGLNISGCNRDKNDDEYDLQREEEFDVNDIRERELDLNE